MNGFAALAVKEAAVASGHGASLLPAIAPSALDGFAVGALLSAVCVLLVMVTRRIFPRGRQSAGISVLANLPLQAATPALAAALSATPTSPATPAAASPFADESAEIIFARQGREDTAQLPELSRQPPAASFQSPDVRLAGRRSKHRLADADRPEGQDRIVRPEHLDRLPETRRGAGRHAAPSIGSSGRMASKRALHQMASRD
jgi:hypothetical protein